MPRVKSLNDIQNQYAKLRDALNERARNNPNEDLSQNSTRIDRIRKAQMKYMSNIMGSKSYKKYQERMYNVKTHAERAQFFDDMQNRKYQDYTTDAAKAMSTP